MQLCSISKLINVGISIGNADHSRQTLVYETHFLTVNAEQYYPHPDAAYSFDPDFQCTPASVLYQGALIQVRRTESGSFCQYLKDETGLEPV